MSFEWPIALLALAALPLLVVVYLWQERQLKQAENVRGPEGASAEPRHDCGNPDV